MFLNFLSKIKNGIKSSTLEEAIGHIKNNNLDEALLLAMEEMTLEARVQYVTDFLKKSHWRIHSSAIDIFVKAVETYLVTKDKKILDKYSTKLSTEARNISMSSSSHVFYQVRVNVINDLLEDVPANSALSISQTFRMEQVMCKEESRKDVDIKFNNTVVDAMSKAWPKKSMLKVLYG